MKGEINSNTIVVETLTPHSLLWRDRPNRKLENSGTSSSYGHCIFKLLRTVSIPFSIVAVPIYTYLRKLESDCQEKYQ